MRAFTILAAVISLASCSRKSEPVAPAPPAVASAAIAAPKDFKAQELPSVEEKRIIKAAQDQKTADGATVLQVLQHAEKMRSKQFKLAGFEMLYTNEGKPSSVGVCYWIGSKRLDDDKFCEIAYELSADRQSLKPAVGSATPEEQRELTVSKLGRGRDTFLKEVDDRYQNECVDYGTKKKSC